jgi:hypothetical protein
VVVRVEKGGGRRRVGFGFWSLEWGWDRMTGKGWCRYELLWL